ncbi:MAG: hypothetical protein J5778_05685 [Clostridiales bacterium]|nr:hypothetical protein [Clostridiales bacterium]
MRKIISVMLVIASLMFMTSCAGAGKMNKDIEDLYKKVCPADEALELAREKGAVVIEDRGVTSGKDSWNDFLKTASAGKTASVIIAKYYTLDKDHVSEELYEQEKDQYPCLYFYLVEYDGKKYSVRVRDCSLEEEEKQEFYGCLLHFTGDAPNEDSLYEKYEYYVLADDPEVTWEKIQETLFSSDSAIAGSIRFCHVYEDYTGWKGK